MIKVLLTGGGSGGHISPLIAVAKELKRIGEEEKLNLDLLYCGSYGDFKKIIENEKIKVVKISGGKMRNYSSVMNFFDFFRFFYSLFQSFFKIFFLMPDVIFSTGGPGALPVVIAGRFYRIPIMIHESNAVPGRTNRISSRLASRIGISFKGAAKYFEGKNIALIGNPIRRELLENIPSLELARNSLGFSKDIPLIMILGGSQGSTRINDFIFSNLDFLISQFQILHQVGNANYSDAKEKENFLLKNFTQEEKSRYKIISYFESVELMKNAYVASDLIISRAGAGTIFEIAAFKKPSILIPLPEAKDQRANAYEFSESGAAVVIEHENLLSNLFRGQIIKILTDKNLKEKMSESASKFAKTDASTIIAKEIIDIGRN